MIAPLLAWSLLMAPPTAPLTEAQKKAEYDMVKVEEVLTPEQIEKRDIIPGWRPIPPKSDIERSVMEIVPEEDNPYLIFATSRVGGNGLLPAELEQLGKPSPSPPGFRSYTGAREGYWYEQINEKGEMTGNSTVVVPLGTAARFKASPGNGFSARRRSMAELSPARCSKSVPVSAQLGSPSPLSTASTSTASASCSSPTWA